MTACPKCGFIFAWDGSRCGHCNYPDAPIPTDVPRDDEWLEGRILHQASRHNLPSRRTFWFHDFAPEIQSEIRILAGETLRGRPVLVFFDSLARWTMLTTREVMGYSDGRLRSMSISDMTSVSSELEPPMGVTSEEMGEWKRTWEYLHVSDSQGSDSILWVPCGGEAYALWNILLMLIRRK